MGVPHVSHVCRYDSEEWKFSLLSPTLGRVRYAGGDVEGICGCQGCAETPK